MKIQKLIENEFFYYFSQGNEKQTRATLKRH